MLNGLMFLKCGRDDDDDRLSSGGGGMLMDMKRCKMFDGSGLMLLFIFNFFMV